jgi:SAM-dependent methyltransferase
MSSRSPKSSNFGMARRRGMSEQAAERLEKRLFQTTVAAFELGAVYLGHRLGYFRGLRDLGNANPGELAAAVGADGRYTREWLEYAAVSELIAVWEQSASSDGRRYALIPGTEAILTDETGTEPAIHDVRCAIASLSQASALVPHYLDGTGLPFSAYGEDMLIGQALATKRGFVRDLGAVWMPALGELHESLLTRADARIADIGFGAGWSTIALARAYTNAMVDGLELDPDSVALAELNARSVGLADRIRFRVQDAADPDLAGRYDLVCAFECLHDMTQPMTVLRAMRQLVGAGGTVLIGDVGVRDAFLAPDEDEERLTYGYSLFHCLPVGLDGPDAVGTGAVMRESTVRSYAAAAGFESVDVLPIEHPSWAFYRLTAPA